MDNYKESFVLQTGDHLSVNDLLDLRKKGCFISRSGHLGNHYLSNLLLFDAGVPCHIFDRNLIIRDQNYWPEFLLLGGQLTPLIDCSESSLVYFHNLDQTKNIHGFTSGAKNLAQVHFRSMERLFGGLVWSESQFLNPHSSLIFRIVSELVRIVPTAFQRVFYEDGVIRKEPSIISNRVAQEVVDTNDFFCHRLDTGNGNLKIGRLTNIEVNILIHSICACLISGQDTVYEVSGPDMIQYATSRGFKERLNAYYQYLRRKIDGLPSKIFLYIVPSFYFRFGSLQSEKEEMDRFWQRLQTFVNLNKEKRQRINATRNTFPRRKVSVDQQNESAKISGPYNRELKVLAGEIHSGTIGRRVDFQLEKGNFFSQYDLLASGDKLYVPSELMKMSMCDLANYYQLFISSKHYFKN